MKSFFTLALLQAAAFARSSQETLHKYLGFAASNNKNLTDLKDLETRLGTYEANIDLIDTMNSKAKGVTFAENWTADLGAADLQKIRGLKVPAQAKQKTQPGRLGGRGLQTSSALNINWVEKQKVTPVKDQGECGSCWAFAATTLQEAMEAIQLNKSPVRLSEQEAVDCVRGTDSHGCNGGWMGDYWDYTKSGARGYHDYPEYNAKDNECRTKTSDPIASTASTWGYVKVADMATQLQKGPMVIDVNASSKCWQFYSSGILNQETVKELNCGTDYDHAVVIVGVHFAKDDEGNDGDDGEDGNDGDDGNDGGDGDGEDQEEEDQEDEDWEDEDWEDEDWEDEDWEDEDWEDEDWEDEDWEDEDWEDEDWEDEDYCANPDDCERVCREANWIENLFEDCFDEDWESGECCHYIPFESVQVMANSSAQNSDGIYLESDDSGTNYWIIQNSWGTSWGENGFIRIEVTDDEMGIVGMNQLVEYMYVQEP